MYHSAEKVGTPEKRIADIRDGLQMVLDTCKDTNEEFLIKELNRHFANYGGLRGIIGLLDEDVRGDRYWRM